MNPFFEITDLCRKEIQAGDSKKALDILNENSGLLSSDQREMIVVLLGRINRITRDKYLGFIGPETWMPEEIRISAAVSYVLNDISDKVTLRSDIQEETNTTNLIDKYVELKLIVEEEHQEHENQENAKEAMEEIQKFLSNFIPELKDFSINFHEKLISTVRDENIFKIEPKRVFVFGESNAGKTTTINNLLKSGIFNSEIFPASDKFSLTQTLNCGEHEGGLIIYDSPGIGDKPIPDNITRAALSIKQKEKKQVDEIIILDATKNKNEGAEKYRKLGESEMLKYINEDAYLKYKDNISGKEFKVSDFQNWAKSKFDFFMFVVPCGWRNGVNERQIEFLEDFYKTIGSDKKVFKIFNIINNREQSRYKENIKELDNDIIFSFEEAVKEFKDNNFPYPEDWIFVDSYYGKGFDKVIKSMAQSLSPDILISIEKSIKSEYSHLIHHKIDEFYLKYVSFVSSIVGCYPVDFWVDGSTVLSYSIKSIFIVSEYIYQDSKNINPNILDNFIKKIKKSKKDYKDTSYFKTETINHPPKYKGTNTIVGDWLNDAFGNGNYEYIPPEEKKIRVEDEEKFYRIGGQFAITATLAIGISLYEIYRGKKQHTESELLKKINQLHAQILKELVPLDIPEKLRKHKHRETRALKVKEIQPKIENFAKKYLYNLKQ